MNTIGYFEIQSSDPKRDIDFYKSIFGCKRSYTKKGGQVAYLYLQFHPAAWRVILLTLTIILLEFLKWMKMPDESNNGIANTSRN